VFKLPGNEIAFFFKFSLRTLPTIILTQKKMTNGVPLLLQIFTIMCMR